jgi:hypothetical protein
MLSSMPAMYSFTFNLQSGAARALERNWLSIQHKSTQRCLFRVFEVVTRVDRFYFRVFD